jgi:hypothetical protein
VSEPRSSGLSAPASTRSTATSIQSMMRWLASRLKCTSAIPARTPECSSWKRGLEAWANPIYSHSDRTPREDASLGIARARGSGPCLDEKWTGPAAGQPRWRQASRDWNHGMEIGQFLPLRCRRVRLFTIHALVPCLILFDHTTLHNPESIYKSATPWMFGLPVPQYTTIDGHLPPSDPRVSVRFGRRQLLMLRLGRLLSGLEVLAEGPVDLPQVDHW